MTPEERLVQWLKIGLLCLIGIMLFSAVVRIISELEAIKFLLQIKS